MKNKKKYILIIFVIAIIIFLCLFFIFNYSEPTILNSKNKKWISDNAGKLIDIEIPNDIPLYSYDGEGVIYDYLDYITNETTLEFNKEPYLKTSKPRNSSYKIEILDGDSKIENNQLLLFKDNYVAISTKQKKINDLKDISGNRIGVLTEDKPIIEYYLNSIIKNVNIITKQDEESLVKSLDKGDINMIILPNILYLNLTIDSNYYINYFFNEISKNIVLTLNGPKELNEIINISYDKYFKEKYQTTYNKNYLNYYIKQNKINDKTRADLLSKTYVYGYVENAPYELYDKRDMEGIAIEYIKRIKRLTDIDVTYIKYPNIEELKKAIDNAEVDIYFNYFDKTTNKYFETKSVFKEKYAILVKETSDIYINSLESLKNKSVAMYKKDLIYNYIKNNSMASIQDYDNIKKLTNNDIIIVDKEVYSYLKNTDFKKYNLVYEDYITSDYNFCVKIENDSFYKLFDYMMNTNSYESYRNNAYNKFNMTIFEKVSFEELYLIILAIILCPVILAFIIIISSRNKKITIIKKQDRKRYSDMLTSLKNRNYLNLNIDKWNNNKRYPQAIIIIDLNNLKYINDNYGREKGDNLIVKASSILVNTQLENSEIIRSDGNEFLIYLIGYNENQIELYSKKLSKSLNELPYGYGAAVGYSMILDNIKTIDDAINEATLEMQSDKERYR